MVLARIRDDSAYGGASDLQEFNFLAPQLFLLTEP